MVPQVYAAIMLGTLVLFWLFSYSDPAHLVPSNVKFTDQLKALKDPKVLKYCQYYSIVFGGYVALSLWMVQYYVGEYGWTSAWPRCWRPASRCPAVCCAPLAACCQ
jgi:NNP family nitrate/nitrite transporter-like MFS transporter